MTIWSLSPESNNPVWYYATIKYLGKVISSNFWLRIEIWKKNHFKNCAHSEKVLEALQHITSLMILEKQRVPLKVYIEPITKTYSHGRLTQTTLALKLILLTEKILRITQRDFTNIYTLHIEIQKSANGLPPSLLKKLFKVNSTVFVLSEKTNWALRWKFQNNNVQERYNHFK